MGLAVCGMQAQVARQQVGKPTLQDVVFTSANRSTPICLCRDPSQLLHRQTTLILAACERHVHCKRISVLCMLIIRGVLRQSSETPNLAQMR